MKKLFAFLFLVFSFSAFAQFPTGFGGTSSPIRFVSTDAAQCYAQACLNAHITTITGTPTTICKGWIQFFSTDIQQLFCAIKQDSGSGGNKFPIADSAWTLLGNAGLTGANFLGTTDAADVIFRQNSTMAGLLNSSLHNTSFGVLALNAGGSFNACFGYGAGQSLTGAGNVAIGYIAAGNTGAGNNNVAIGNQALANNITGIQNIAVGARSLQGNQTDNNIGIGFRAGGSITTGTDNTVIGFQSMLSLTTQNENVGIGNNVGISTFADSNTYIGYAAAFNVQGGNCVAIGNNAPGISNEFGNWVQWGNFNTTQNGFIGAFEPFYSAAFQPGATGQALISQGPNVSPQWGLTHTAGVQSDTVFGTNPVLTSNGIQIRELRPGVITGTVTLNLPTSPNNGDLFDVDVTNNITSLTITGTHALRTPFTASPITPTTPVHLYYSAAIGEWNTH